MIALYTLAGIALLISLLVDRQKSIRALRIAAKRLYKIHRPLLLMIVLVAISLAILSEERIAGVLEQAGAFWGLLVASAVGSVAIIPGFIAFPLSGILREAGVSYMVLSAFTTTLMMVGITTFPMESAHFGSRFALLRNGVSFLIAISVALVTGLLFGEILL